ncbi:hypothetical protein [Pseudorhodoplanes sp.]|uniref:hypothetical protein n=1 Tax=Pseudorhodoplanes sp. TaxID=1934341 RepID=UPI003D0DA1EC
MPIGHGCKNVRRHFEFQLVKIVPNHGSRLSLWEGCRERTKIIVGKSTWATYLGWWSVIAEMLSVVTRRMRLRAAVFLAVLYALTVLTPHIALAFAGPGGYVHCLNQQKSAHEHSGMSGHDHADASVHSHAGKAAAPDSEDSQGPAAACCGLFSVTALTSEPRVDLPAPPIASRILPFPSNGVDGQGPGRIIRPPIV